MDDAATTALTGSSPDEARPRTADAPHAARAGETIPGGVIVAVIALLVVVVSMPRFRAHVVGSNRADARKTLALLGGTLFEEQWALELDGADVPETLMGVIEAIPPLQHRFRDARRVPGSTELRHHGYLFNTGHVLDAYGTHAALVAWPVEYARTGDAAFALTAGGELWIHANGGLWTSLERPLVDVDLSDEGWHRR